MKKITKETNCGINSHLSQTVSKVSTKDFDIVEVRVEVNGVQQEQSNQTEFQKGNDEGGYLNFPNDFDVFKWW